MLEKSCSSRVDELVCVSTRDAPIHFFQFWFLNLDMYRYGLLFYTKISPNQEHVEFSAVTGSISCRLSHVTSRCIQCPAQAPPVWLTHRIHKIWGLLDISVEWLHLMILLIIDQSFFLDYLLVVWSVESQKMVKNVNPRWCLQLSCVDIQFMVTEDQRKQKIFIFEKQNSKKLYIF